MSLPPLSPASNQTSQNNTLACAGSPAPEEARLQPCHQPRRNHTQVSAAIPAPEGARLQPSHQPRRNNTPASAATPAPEGARLQPCHPRRIAKAALAAGVSLALFLGILSPSPAQAQSQLTPIYTQMDAAAKRFQNATADVERDNYERVVKETTVEKGTMYIQRAGTGMEFGATVSGQGSPTPSRVVNFSGNTLAMYTPAEKQVDLFKAGANQSTLEGYLALGFGGTSQALQQAWTVTDAGPETLSDGAQQIKTEKLVLVSKDPGVRNTFKQITLWLDPARDVSLKQLFETPSGDRQTAIYTNIKLNTRINKAPYKIPTGKGVTVVNH